MRVAAAQAVRLEVCPVRRECGDLWAEGPYGEVVAPDLAVVRALEDLCFEGGLAVDTCMKEGSVTSVFC